MFPHLATFESKLLLSNCKFFKSQSSWSALVARFGALSYHCEKQAWEKIIFQVETQRSGKTSTNMEETKCCYCRMGLLGRRTERLFLVLQMTEVTIKKSETCSQNKLSHSES